MMAFFLSFALILFSITSAFSQSTANIYVNSPHSSQPLHQESSLSITSVELNAFLSHQLGISDYETLPESLYPTTRKGQIVLGGLHSALPENEPSLEYSRKVMIVVHGTDGSKLFPAQFIRNSLHLSLHNSPDSLSFDGLISTYIGRIVHSKNIPLSSIYGVREFLTAYHDGIGGGILDNLEDWAKDWEGSVMEWIEWGKDLLKVTNKKHGDAQMQPQEEYSRWLNSYGPLDSSARGFIEDLKMLDEYAKTLSSTKSPPKITLLRLSGLQQIQRQHGENSPQYRAAFQTLRSFLEATLSNLPEYLPQILIGVPSQPAHTRLGKRMNLSVLAPFQTSDSSFVRRELIERRRSIFVTGSSVPIIASTRKCYISQSECESSTSNCNDHGQCIEGQKTSGGKCFVCGCKKSKDTGGKLVDWSGEMCQKQDISGGFVLLTGSAIALVILFGVAIALLASIGAEGLPQQLSSVSGSSKKMD